MAAAESATRGQGMVYMEEYKLYYDYSTGYYYDADKRLYYDGHKKKYLRYNEESKTYDEVEAEAKEDGELEDGDDDDESPQKTEEELWEEEVQRQRENGLVHKDQPPSMRIIVTKASGESAARK